LPKENQNKTGSKAIYEKEPKEKGV